MVHFHFFLLGPTDKRCEPILKQEHVRNFWAHSGKTCMAEYLSGGPINLPKFLPISFFRRVSRFIGVSGHLAFQ